MVVAIVAVFVLLILVIILIAACACYGGFGSGGECCPSRRVCLRSSDLLAYAPNQDPNMINPFGIDSNDEDVWVAENGSGYVTLLDNTGKTQKSVLVPLPLGSDLSNSNPTGLELNRSFSDSQFVLSSAGVTGPAIWLVASANGTVAGYNSTVNSAQALTVIDNSSLGAVYTGLTIGYTGACSTDACGNKTTTTVAQLYVTNLAAGQVEMYDSSFTFIKSFTDAGLTPGSVTPVFAPFGIKSCGDNLFVSFALQNSAQNDVVPGSGLGFIDLFSLSGVFRGRLFTGGSLNAPFGMCLTDPCTMLVSNNGDGKISEFKLSLNCNPCDPCRQSCAKFTDYVRSCRCRCDTEPLVFDGLYGINQRRCGSLWTASGPNAGLNGVVAELRCC